MKSIDSLYHKCDGKSDEPLWKELRWDNIETNVEGRA